MTLVGLAEVLHSARSEGRKLAWTHLDPDDATNRDVWENLPKLFWYFPVKRKKELATTVAVHPFDKDEENAKMPRGVSPLRSGSEEPGAKRERALTPCPLSQRLGEGEPVGTRVMAMTRLEACTCSTPIGLKTNNIFET